MSAHPRVWLGPVGIPCQVLEARKNWMGRIRTRILKISIKTFKGFSDV